MEELDKTCHSDCGPDGVTFASLINVYSKGNLPQKAESVLNWMEEQYKLTGENRFQPTNIHYNTVIDSWVRKRDDNRSGEKAEMLFNAMLKSYESGDEEVKPDLLTFNLVMRALGNSGDAASAQKVEAMLLMLESGMKQFEEIRTNVKTYNIAINVWSKCKGKGSAKRAEAIFHRMKELYESGTNDQLKPDVYTYTTLIDAYSKIGASKKAEGVLALMEEDGVPANVLTYNSLISSWARNGDQSAPEEAERILDRMISAGIKPETSSYTALMNVYSKSRDRGSDICNRVEEILRFMENKYQDGDLTLKPNVWSYTTVSWQRHFISFYCNAIANVVFLCFRLLTPMQSQMRN